MIREEKALRKRKCRLCGRDIPKGEMCVRFDSGGSCGFTTIDNLCIRCMNNIVIENCPVVLPHRNIRRVSRNRFRDWTIDQDWRKR